MGQNSLQLPYGVKVLNPNPIDPRKEVNSLDDIKNAANYYVGFSGIANLSEPDGAGGFVKYDVVGGTAVGGWVFAISSKKDLDTEERLNDFELTWFEGGGYINSTGGVNPHADFSYTDYIPLRPNSAYHHNAWGGSVNAYTAYYDVNKVFIGGISQDKPSGDGHPVLPPVKAAFARLTNRDTQQSYTVVRFTLDGSIKEFLNKLADKAQDSFEYLNLLNLVTIGDTLKFTKGGYIKSNGDISTFADYSYTDYYRVVAGLTYDTNAYGKSGGGVGFAFYDKNKTYIYDSYVDNPDGSSSVKSIVIPDDAVYIRFTNRHISLENHDVSFSGGISAESLSFLIRKNDLKTKIFELNWVIGGGYVKSDGTVQGHEDYDYFDYEEIEEGQIYLLYLRGGNSSNVYTAFYDAAQVFIKAIITDVPPVGGHVIVPPRGAKYMRGSNRNTYLSTDLTYLTTPDSLALVVQQLLKSTTDLQNEQTGLVLNQKVTSARIDFFQLNWISGGFINSDGGITNHAEYDYSDYFPIDPELIYLLYLRGGNTSNVFTAFYDVNKVHISGIITNVPPSDGHVINPPANAAFLRTSNRFTYLPTEETFITTPDNLARYASLLEKRIAILEGGDLDPAVLTRLHFDIDNLQKRALDAQDANRFRWSAFDKAYITIFHDDSNASTGLIKDVMSEYGFPCNFAAMANKLDSDAGNGKTVREVYDEAIEEGGEIFAHDGNVITGNVYEVDELQITGAATVDGNITITLNGETFVIAVVNGDTPEEIADKIFAATFTGWQTSQDTDTITWIKSSYADCVAPTFDAGATGITAILTRVTEGFAESSLAEYEYLFIETKRLLEEAGYVINGIIRPGGAGTTTRDNVKTLAYLHKYYRYANDFTSYADRINYPQYFFARTMSDITTLKAGIDTAVANKEQWGLFIHSWSDLSEADFRELLDHIDTYVQAGTAEVVNYKYLYDTFRSTELEERIKALEP